MTENQEATCKGCGIAFIKVHKEHEFHDENCRVRYNRRKMRESNPVKETWRYTCSSCQVVWESKVRGRYKFCPMCREKHDQEQAVEGKAKRVKSCSYRACGREFVDASLVSSMSYCCPEHARREKMFRSGKITDVSQFRFRDPILEADESSHRE